MTDVEFMRHALKLARQAAQENEVPVGAVLVWHNKIVGEGFNQRECRQDPLAHAEILALRQGAKQLGCWRLRGCTLYCTLEPCPMCAGALVNARVDRLVFGAPDPKAGACGTLMQLCRHPRLNHRLAIQQGVLATESTALLQGFFAARRRGEKHTTRNLRSFAGL
ncbi:MAG: tRNA adenosine(34) deaminase TadA [Myxococcota bacterium]